MKKCTPSLSTSSSPLEMLPLSKQQQQSQQQQYQCETAAAEEELLFQRAAAFNQKGIQWLQHCHHGGDSRSAHRALTLFRAALECTLVLLEGQKSSNISSSNNDLLLFEDKEKMIMLWDMGDFAPHSPSLVESVFVRPFQLNPSLSSAYSSDPLINVSVIFALLMFNMGIASHLEAIMKASEDQEIVGDNLPSCKTCSKARMLYEKSVSVLNKIGLLRPASSPRSSAFSIGLTLLGCFVTDLLHLALYNNLTHIACSLNDFLAAKSYSHHLQSFCCYLQPRVTTLYPDAPEIQKIVLNCAQSLWLNVQEPYFLHLPKIAASA